MEQVVNKFELFERLLSFLGLEDELNPVLSGYFCKVLAQLVATKPKEVFGYVYTHPKVLDDMVRHSYQKSVSDILIRLLNTTENVFNNVMEYAEVNSIRASFVYKIVMKLSPESSFEDNLNA